MGYELEIPEELREDVVKLQQLQQQHQALLLQKQSLELELSEIEAAMKEVEKSIDSEIYEIVSNVMIKKDRDSVLSSLKERKEIINLRVSSLDKQITSIASKLNELQSRIAEKMKKPKSGEEGE
ncbi:MAG: prefoldin subunit beta [Candidatus Nanoarchaeia archaeon]|nr:prefoldin subunit beta [Candidatus Haiyanarchaeum thermophilum]MCW1302891.1 prefoldin subunit beta [Candidatus Haiyanarchaeum thermophilum]MCW1303570.1 prefoldin subunit beta [Candidatus Haiyanarchaeum thermophilum]MCW1306252.1 prefoldin subunit beta [Candidatus Haiyanarchaeum thermophilum]MCW1307512.1 prefoldin subunit beta [Candidatus Haiyanarchaeum thermophilum]